MKLNMLILDPSLSNYQIRLSTKGGRDLGSAETTKDYPLLVTPYKENEVYSIYIDQNVIYITIREASYEG